MRTANRHPAVPMIELVRWPHERERREALARAGIPRLLVVEEGAALPASVGVDEDWVRLPVDDDELHARALRLRRMVDDLARTAAPYVDEHRLLHRAGHTVLLSVHEAAIVEALLERPGRVVPRTTLAECAWHGDAPSTDAVDAAIYRLRRRLSGLGISIRAVRGRGFAVRFA